MAKLLVFDIWGNYGHYKKIYATTSALTYPIPFKTAIYGLVGAIIGLSKDNNEYLNSFQKGKCKIGIELREVPKTQRIHTNLSPEPGPIKLNPKSNTPYRKPTLLELLRNPKYRIFFTHEDSVIYDKLKKHLVNHTSIYTPSMGLANLLANFEFIGEYEYSNFDQGTRNVNGVMPAKNVKELDVKSIRENQNEIMQIGMYALEMDIERNVTERDELLFDRSLKPIKATVEKTALVKEYDSSDFHITLF